MVTPKLQYIEWAGVLHFAEDWWNKRAAARYRRRVVNALQEWNKLGIDAYLLTEFSKNDIQ